MIQLKTGISPSALKPPKAADRRQNRSAKKTNGGLRFERVFSDPAMKPFDQIEWEHRTAEITDDSGTVIFKQENVEVPKNWSALARVRTIFGLIRVSGLWMHDINLFSPPKSASQPGYCSASR